MSSVIKVEDLERTYTAQTGFLRRSEKSVSALTGVSFTVGQGEVFGLLGPNGAGKTTTIKILTTLLTPTGGRAEVLGLDVVRQARELRSRINVVFGGERNLYYRLTGRENLQYFADLYRIPLSRQRSLVPELIDAVGLGHASDRRVETYSKGMKQRLSIARALINNPEVLFLDEPTIGLDPVAAQELRQLVAALADKGTTVILTTHYMYEAELLSHRIAIVKGGKLVALDTPAALKQLAVGLSVVEALVQGMSQSDLAALREHPCSKGMQQSALGPRLMLQFPTENPEETMRAVSALVPSTKLIELKTRQATLEDAYVRLVEDKAV